MKTPGQFASDIEAIRKRAREHLEQGAVTPNYGGDVKTAIQLLNEAVATEMVCVLRYRYHAITATGIASEAVKKEFEPTECRSVPPRSTSKARTLST